MVRTLTIRINKAKLARELGISRSSLYYERKRERIDEELKKQIESVMIDHTGYGHKRIAIELKMGKNRIRRIMKKYNLKPYRRRAKKPTKKKDQGKPATNHKNLLASLLQENAIKRPDQVWCTDFTYIRYKTMFIYLATIIDLYTREIVGVNISRYHNRFLVIGAVEDALQKGYNAPDIIHSDQGSEYDSHDFEQFINLIQSTISMSDKGSPWQNGYKESFYSHFKKEAGDLNRFESLGELIEYIYNQIYYYNNRRIHSVFKMTPAQYRKRHSV